MMQNTRPRHPENTGASDLRTCWGHERQPKARMTEIVCCKEKGRLVPSPMVDQTSSLFMLTPARSKGRFAGLEECPLRPTPHQFA